MNLNIIKIVTNALGVLIGIFSLVSILTNKSNTYFIPLGMMLLALFMFLIADRIEFYIDGSKQKKLSYQWKRSE